MPAPRRESLAFTASVTVIVVLSALPMGLVVALSGAPGTVLLALVLASVPVAPLVRAYLWLDRYEPEPKPLLALGLLWGAVVATFAALLIGGVGGLVVPVTEAQSLAVVAPVSEEATKGVFLLALLWWRRHELDGILDGIVYAGMVGIGFAFVENVLYLAAAYNGTDGVGPGGIEGVTTTFVVRCLASPFAHPLFTAFTGIGVGVAVNSRILLVRVVAPIFGYCCAVIAHGLWNGSTIGGFGSFAVVYVLLMVPAFVLLVAFATWIRSAERRVLYASLVDAARRGLFPAQDIAWIVDLGGRRRALRFARDTGGPAVERAMRDYQMAAVELGFLHHRYLRGTAPRDFATRGQHFVNELQAIRPHIRFPGQAVPSR